MLFTRSIQCARYTSFDFLYPYLVQLILYILATKVVWYPRNHKNMIILSFIPLHEKYFVFCRFYKCSNLVYERSIERKYLWNFYLFYELLYHLYSKKLQLIHHSFVLYNHLCLGLTLKLLPIKFHLMLFPDKPDLQFKKHKTFSRKSKFLLTSKFLPTDQKASDICS